MRNASPDRFRPELLLSVPPDGVIPPDGGDVMCVRARRLIPKGSPSFSPECDSPRIALVTVTGIRSSIHEFTRNITK